MGVKTLVKLRKILQKKTEESKYSIAVNRFERTPQSYDKVENDAVSVMLVDMRAHRKLAHDAGFTDSQLLDMWCEEGDKLKKDKIKQKK